MDDYCDDIKTRSGEDVDGCRYDDIIAEIEIGLNWYNVVYL